MQAFRRPSGWATECNGTTYVAVLEDDLGTNRFVFCDAGRTSALDAWEARRRPPLSIPCRRPRWTRTNRST